MNAISLKTLPQEHVREWRQFWARDARRAAGPGFYFEVYDDNTVIRDSLGNFLDRIDINAARYSVIERLVQLRAQRNHP